MRLALTAALAVVLAACAGNSAPSPTASPAITPGLTSAPTAGATTGPVSTPTYVSSPAATPATVPQADLTLDGVTYSGKLGSFVIDGHGSDGPWLPATVLRTVKVKGQQALSIGFVDGAVIGDATAVRAAASDTAGKTQEAVAVATIANGTRSITVGPLPVGQWVLAVRLFRADGRGDGTTYWAITVS